MVVMEVIVIPLLYVVEITTIKSIGSSIIFLGNIISLYISYTDDKQSWQGVILKSWKAWSSCGLYVHEGILFANVYDLSKPLLLQHLIVNSRVKIRRLDLD